MTFALIIIIAFFAIAFLQTMNLAAKAQNDKRRTKTNITLQNKIVIGVRELVSNEINSYITAACPMRTKKY